MGRPSSYLGHAITPPSLESIQAPRPRLVNALNEKLDKKLILISAPAGFGKTTLLAEFSAQADRPVCWVRLTEADQDVMRLSEVLWTSLTRRFRRLRGAVRIEGLAGASSRALARAIAQALKDQVREPCVMVFDDVHWLNPSENGRAFLAELVKEGPDGQTIVTGGRELPDIPLVQLLASDQLATFDSDSLALRADELGEVVKRRTGEDVSEALVGDLMEETGGWVTGVLLSERLVSHHVPSLIAADEPLAYDYLAMAVFDRQPAAVQRFLLDSSVLPIMTAELCDSVLGRNDSQAMLNDLLRRGIFISVTDDDPKTYEYHQLFSSFLQSRAKTRDEQKHRRLLIRSARALSETDEWAEDAVELLMAAGEAREARPLALYVAEKLFHKGRLETLRRWSNYFQHKEIGVPNLNMHLASLLEAFGHRLEVIPILTVASSTSGTLEETEQLLLQRRISGSKAFLALAAEDWLGLENRIRELRDLLDGRSDPNGWVRLLRLEAFLAADHHGDRDAAKRFVVLATERFGRGASALHKGLAWTTRAYVECYAGDLASAETSAERATEVFETNGIFYGLSAALMDLAYVRHLRGRYGSAMHTLDRAKKAAAAVDSKYVEETVAISELEMISELGLLPEAVRQVGDLKESICKKEGSEFWKKYVIALQAALHRRSGDIAGARLAIEEGRSLPNANVHTRLVIEHLALLSKSSPDKVLSFVWSVWRSVPFTAQDRTLALFFLARSCYKMENYKRATWWAQMALRRSSERGAIQMVAAELDVDHEFLNFLSDHIIDSRELRAVELRIREMHASAIRHYRLTSERVSTKAGVKIVALGLPQVIVEDSHVTSLAPLEIRLLVYLAENQRVEVKYWGSCSGVAWHRRSKQAVSIRRSITCANQSVVIPSVSPVVSTIWSPVSCRTTMSLTFPGE